MLSVSKQHIHTQGTCVIYTEDLRASDLELLDSRAQRRLVATAFICEKNKRCKGHILIAYEVPLYDLQLKKGAFICRVHIAYYTGHYESEARHDWVSGKAFVVHGIKRQHLYFVQS